MFKFFNTKKIFSFLALLLFSFSLAKFSFGADLGTNYAGNLGLAGGGIDPRVLAVNVIRYLLTFVGIIATSMVLYGGFVWMTAGGNADKVAKAKKILISSSIGLVVTVSSFAIVTFVMNTVNDQLEQKCVAGTHRVCGCDGMGDQVCQADGTWSNCDHLTCSFPQVCCYDDDTTLWGCKNNCATKSFVPVNNSPSDGSSDLPKNIKIKFVTNRKIDPTSVSTSTTFLVRINGNDATGTLSVLNNRIVFSPTADCGANACGLTNNCFASGSTVDVTANNGILSFDGLDLDCTGGGCNFSFSVGDFVDCDKPKVSFDFNQVCASSSAPLYARSSDGTGIDRLEFFADNTHITPPANPASVNPVNNADNDSPFNTRDEGLPVYWNSTSYGAGTAVKLSVAAWDLVGNHSTTSRSYTLKPAHCCNGELDAAGSPNLASGEAPEEGVDCGGECAACDGAACGVSLHDSCSGDCSEGNDLCASYYCSCANLGSGCQDAGYDAGIDNCCVCQSAPIIDWLSPVGGFCRNSSGNPINLACSDDSNCGLGTCDTDTPNGAPGNLVTIGGRFFGDYNPSISRVEFLNDSGAWVKANLASSSNSHCVNSWTDTRVVVVVPGGVATNNAVVRITADSGGLALSDTTQDDRGPLIDFVRNAINRPGLCLISPDHGAMGELVTYQGVHLSGSLAYFGNKDSNIPALNNNFPGPSGYTGTAQVPDFKAGKTSTFVESGGIISNYLDFYKEKDSVQGPFISYFTPTQGNVGQYVTVRGQGFGNRKGNSKLYFDGDGDLSTFGDQVEANYEFPQACQNNLWKDTQIIVKVPSGLTNGNNYHIVLDLDNWSEAVVSGDTFHFDDSLSLAPSLCDISPKRGPNFEKLTLFGEYFQAKDPYGNNSTRVRFNLNHDQFGNNVGVGLGWGDDATLNFATTTVHGDAVSGPVSLVLVDVSAGPCTGASDCDAGWVCSSDGLDDLSNSYCQLQGNSLNFEVGNCENNEDCGGDICCPVGSYMEHRCVDNADDCYINIPASVYEWTFTTEEATTTPVVDPTDSCQGVAHRTGNCAPIICPNSPGTCSHYAGGATSSVGVCGDGVCGYLEVYNEDLNRCASTSCSLASSTLVRDILDRPVQAYCDDDGDGDLVGKWYFDTNLSCPANWTKLYNRCVLDDGTTCSLCVNTYTCMNDNDGDFDGLCVGDPICPAGSHCENNECIKESKASCDCCCEIGESERDCCAYEDPGGAGYIQLECHGFCGEDKLAYEQGVINAEQTYGYCSGCRIENPSGTVNQSASDNACNCSGHSGKYCDVDVDVNGDGRADGICVDCASLDTDQCSAHHNTCCVDAMHDNKCRGVGEGSSFNDGSGTYYCAYYDCQAEPNQDQCVDNPQSSGPYKTEEECDTKCALNAPSGLGLSCAPTRGYAYATTTCNFSVCADPFSCLRADGTDGNFADSDCGVCCCEPGSDDCDALGLNCQADKGPCTGDNRGLCCGCEADSDCVAVGGTPTDIGCGNDTCCHSRPYILNVFPPNEDVDTGTASTCRNTLIRAEFNESMNISSFTGNVIVVGDYGSEVCPSGTNYLTQIKPTKKHNIFVRIFLGIKNLFIKIARLIMPKHFAKAYIGVHSNHNYCAISGKISAYNEMGRGVMEFYPTHLLDADRWYYVIIKGDSDLGDAKSDGVLSTYGVGMNGGSATTTFNAITYNNAYIWSFKTMDEQGANNGICTLDHISLKPHSYLFTTNQNDPADDDFLNDDFDKIKDNDKLMVAYPLNSKDQILAPIANVYDWNWAWNLSNGTDFTLVNIPLSANKKIATTSRFKVNARTVVTAQLTIDNSPFGDGGISYEDLAKLYLFVCQNPWPPVDVLSGEWEPWIDNTGNCDINSANCVDTEYEVYYCRDKGGKLSKDDLPALVSRDDMVIIGSSTDKNVLKEAYMFGEQIPEYLTELEVKNEGSGKTASTSWSIAGITSTKIDTFKIYWGRRSGSYDNYEEVKIDGTEDSDYLEDCSVDAVNDILECKVIGLRNNTLYYFNLTGLISSTSVETEYYGEKHVVVKDINLEAIPDNLSATPGNTQVLLQWDEVESASSYNVYYGTNPGVYGKKQNVGNETTVIVSGLTNETTYYFTVTSVDASGNESLYSGEASATPAETESFTTGSGDIVLIWNTDGSGDYEIYYEEMD